jgi:hypothetical protein
VLTVIALALALQVSPVPGDGVRLAPDPVVTTTIAADAPATGSGFPLPPVAGGGALVGLAAVALAGRTRRREPDSDAEPLVVFVSGHGNDSAPGLFSDLVALMGLDPGQARYFDYRWAAGGFSHDTASENASIDETADALAGYLAGLEELGRPIYLVGFSKGGAGIAELLARWDRDSFGDSHGVVGATLLDPPLASGVHGWLQSVGTAVGFIPDDGGYNPIHCDGARCVDTRVHLGEASGVEVMVVRNPQAGITNFADVPDGLRVYEAPDGGPGFLQTLVTRPWDLVSRATDAHLAVLDDPKVAQCISAEITGSGTCALHHPGYAPPAGQIVHGPGNPLKLPLHHTL